MKNRIHGSSTNAIPLLTAIVLFIEHWLISLNYYICDANVKDTNDLMYIDLFSWNLYSNINMKLYIIIKFIKRK